MKKKYYALIIVVAILLCVFLVFLTFHKSHKSEKESSNATGDITIIEDANLMTEQEKLELEQNMVGDEAFITEDTPILMCNVTDENNVIIGSNFLPLIAMASYHNTITEFLVNQGYTGTLNLSVIDNSVYNVNNYYYFAFYIEEENKTLYCSFNELTLAFDIKCS
mgnify:CR=1 FL=1